MEFFTQNIVTMLEISDISDIFNLLILIFRIYLYISIIILPFVLYNSFFESRYKPNSNYYYKKEWYHFLKVLWAKSGVNKYKKSFSDVIKNESDQSLEQPRKLTTFMRSDSQVIYGVDQKGNSLYIRLTLRERRLSESCVQIRLADGQIFQLPEHPLILICSIPERKWQAKGLELTVIEPFSTIRITYNGFLRNHIRTNENEETGEVSHCRFDFTWTSATEAKFFPQEVSTQELAEAVAVEPWRDAKWIKLLGFNTGYDQYGSLVGSFTFSTPITELEGTSMSSSNTSSAVSTYTSKTLRLTGHRKRSWGPREANAMHRMLTLYGADGKGFGFSVGVKSYSKGCKELHIGSVMLPNKNIIFIEDCDISLPDFFEDGIIPGAFSFSFKAGGKLYKCTAFTHKISIADMRNEESMGYNGKLVRTKYIINGEEANGYGVFWYRYQGGGIELPAYIIRPGIQTIEPERKYVASLTSPECRSIYLAGVKGTSLALLTAVKTDKFQTLDGFCILAPALDKYLEKNPQIKEELTKLNDICCGIVEGNLQEACDRVQHLFATTPPPQVLQDLVIRELTLLRFSVTSISTSDPARGCWCIRGSAVHQPYEQDIADRVPEHRENTFLDAFTSEDVLKAVTRCWGGGYDLEKVQYRRKKGLPIICDMAIVIQYTLDADMAGVLTTQHPETGSSAQMTVTANYGLGLGTVTNNVVPDKATICRTWNGCLSIFSTEPGSKSHKIIIGDRGITKVENKNNNFEFCLSKNQILQIGKAGIDIEKALGGPVKIEWAFYKDQLYILNTFSLPNNFNSLPVHVLNSPILSPADSVLFNSTDNLFNSNDVCCALTKSTCVRFLDQAIQKVDDGAEKNRGSFRKLAMMNGAIGSDVFQTILRNVDKEITEELKIHELVTTGRSFITKELHQEAVYRNQVTKWRENILNLFRSLSYCWNSADYTEEATVLSQAIKVTSHPESSALDHLKIIKRNLHLFKHIIFLHTAVNHCYVFWQKLFFNLMHDEPSKVTALEMRNFLSHYSSDSVYQISSKVRLLAAVIHTRDLGDNFIALEPSEAIVWLELHALDCVELIEKIMEEFGTRGVNEFEFTSEPWENNTFALIKIIQMIVQKMKTDNNFENEKCDELVKNSKIENKLTGKFASWLNTRLQNIFNRRSKTLESVSVTVNKFRRSYFDLGKKLVHEGKLPNPKLIFHLTQKEIQIIVTQKRPELVDRAMKRATLHQTLKPNIPDLFTGAELPTSKQQEGTSFEKFQRVIGNTVVGGHVVGKICILENIKQVEHLQQGDILVTKSLDLGWSPYFGVISGLICETGSFISQGFIAVQKKNLPCILAKDAMKIFQNGDQVVMIADTGVVEKIL